MIAEELGKFADMYGVTTEWILGRNQTSESVSSSLLLAARELGKLKKTDLDKVIGFLQTIKSKRHSQHRMKWVAS